MRTLSGQEILYIWETGSGQYPLDRAMTMLAVAGPELSHAELLALSVGQRDAHLLAIRERAYGSQLPCYAECPACGERLEFVLDVTDLQVMQGVVPATQTQQMIYDGYELRYRLPNTTDLAAIAHCASVALARDTLVQRCVLQVSQEGTDVAPESLPEPVIAVLAAHMLEQDPQAEILLDMQCPGCEHRWSVIFDIVLYFWTELCGHAKRLMREVHTLAQAYGWSEADIVAMSAARRQFYIDMVAS
jgi:hypothetical protein